MRLLVFVIVFALPVLVGCEGPVGPEGPEGPAGQVGPEGPAGIPSVFTFFEIQTGTTGDNGEGQAFFEGRSVENTIFACWLKTGTEWDLIALDTNGRTDSGRIAIARQCWGEDVPDGLLVGVWGVRGSSYRIVALGP